MTTYLLPLIADLSAPGVPTPGAPATHFDKCDEDPNDGDTTRVRYTAVGMVESYAWDPSLVPADAIIVSLTVRWAWKGTTSDQSVASAGVRLGGIDYFAPSRSFTAGQPYTAADEILITNPATGLPWLPSELAGGGVSCIFNAGPVELGGPRISQLVPFVTVLDQVSRSSGAASSQAPDAAASGGGAPGAASSSAPDAAASSSAPAAQPSSAAPDAAASSSSPAGAASAAAPRAAASSGAATSTPTSTAPVARPISLATSAVPSKHDGTQGAGR
jgi:hypothetical protein